MGYLATESQADAEYAHNVGFDNQDRAWILSDRDVWYPNPFYTGPKQPHPEEYEFEQQDCGTYQYNLNPVYAEDEEIPF